MRLAKPLAGLLTLFASALPGSRVTAALPQQPPSRVVIVLEDGRGRGKLVGSGEAPYLNSLASAGALMTGAAPAGRPCGEMDLELFSGSRLCVGAGSAMTPSLCGELSAAGLGFTGFAEGLPCAGYTGPGAGAYTREHNPWAGSADVPPTASQPFTSFPGEDFAALPTVSIVVPNLDHNLHRGGVPAADRWLRDHLESYVRWADTHRGLLVVVLREGGLPGEADRTVTLFRGPMVRPGVYGERVEPARILRTLEDLYGLGHTSAAAKAVPIDSIWNGGGAGVASAAYAITASAGPNGTISPSGIVNVAAGGSQTFNVDAAPGYSVSSVVVDGVDQGPICTYTFGNVTAGHTIAAAFATPGRFTITASAGAGGAISPSGAVNVASGGTQTFTITPASGYSLSLVTVDGISKGALPTYTFSNVMANHTISAAFAGPAPSGGKVISIDFVGRASVMAASDVAGTVPRSHWNSAPGAAQSTPLSLVDEKGAGTGATLTWAASGVWSLPSVPATEDGRMMSGYLDAVGANTIIRVAGLPASAGGYDVLVYLDGDNGGATRNGIYQISGTGVTTTSITAIDAGGANFTGAFAQAASSKGNYVRFHLSANGFNLTAIPSTTSDAYPRAPVNGMQIVPVGP